MDRMELSIAGVAEEILVDETSECENMGERGSIWADVSRLLFRPIGNPECKTVGRATSCRPFLSLSTFPSRLSIRMILR